LSLEDLEKFKEYWNKRLENIPLDILNISQLVLHQELVTTQIPKELEVEKGNIESTSSAQCNDESLSTNNLDKVWDQFDKIVNTTSQETQTTNPIEILKTPEVTTKILFTIRSSDKEVILVHTTSEVVLKIE